MLDSLRTTYLPLPASSHEPPHQYRITNKLTERSIRLGVC